MKFEDCKSRYIEDSANEFCYEYTSGKKMAYIYFDGSQWQAEVSNCSCFTYKLFDDVYAAIQYIKRLIEQHW